MAPTLIDLFAGCGGLTAGFVRHGYTPVLAVEHNLHAAATYALNFGEAHIRWGDIADLDAVPPADVVIGGPPCQGFSNLGSKHLDDPRNRLWREYLRVVQAARPQVFVIENVDRFRRSTEFALLLEQADHGVIADYSSPTACSRPPTTAYRSAAPARSSSAPASGRSRCRRPHTAGADVANRARRHRRPPGATGHHRAPVDDIEVFGSPCPASSRAGTSTSAASRGICRCGATTACRPGGGRFDLPDELLPRCWREKPTGTTDVMGRMRWDQPSLTIRTEFFKPEKGQYLHPQWDAGPHGG